jgi:protoporphyrinogen oxidase
MYRPSLAEVLRGSLTAEVPNTHYITDFRYPARGGFYSYVRGLSKDLQFNLDRRVVAIDPKARTASFADGSSIAFDALVSSIPLPEFLPMIRGIPDDVRRAAGLLACSSCVLVNLGVAREDLSKAHISYFYDEDLTVSRTSYPHMMSPHTVPAGHGSVQAEVYFSAKYRPFTGQPTDYIAPVIRDLTKCGVLRDSDNIVFGYLDDIRIRTCGRYGAWGYFWTDDSFKSGESAATRALEDLTIAA